MITAAAEDAPPWWQLMWWRTRSVLVIDDPDRGIRRYVLPRDVTAAARSDDPALLTRLASLAQRTLTVNVAGSPPWRDTHRDEAFMLFAAVVANPVTPPPTAAFIVERVLAAWAGAAGNPGAGVVSAAAAVLERPMDTPVCARMVTTAFDASLQVPPAGWSPPWLRLLVAAALCPNVGPDVAERAFDALLADEGLPSSVRDELLCARGVPLGFALELADRPGARPTPAVVAAVLDYYAALSAAVFAPPTPPPFAVAAQAVQAWQVSGALFAPEVPFLCAHQVLCPTTPPEALHRYLARGVNGRLREFATANLASPNRVRTRRLFRRGRPDPLALPADPHQRFTPVLTEALGSDWSFMAASASLWASLDLGSETSHMCSALVTNMARVASFVTMFADALAADLDVDAAEAFGRLEAKAAALASGFTIVMTALDVEVAGICAHMFRDEWESTQAYLAGQRALSALGELPVNSTPPKVRPLVPDVALLNIDPPMR